MPDLQTLFNTVPIANSGEVVTEEYHNSLRDTLEAVIGQLSAGPVSQTATLSFQPAFLTNDPGPNWVQSNGNASIGTTGVANGWLPVQFPDGVRIQNMTIIGQRSGDINIHTGDYTIWLYRQSIADSTQYIQLITVEWAKDIGSNSNSAPLKVQGAGSGANEDFKLVDNSTYKYYVIASISGVTVGIVAAINTIQLVYSRS